jgi:molybdopterin-guanine dinucleotide biosynthesis protein A
MPLMSPEFCTLMLSKLPGPEAVIMRFNDGMVEPLCGIYASACLPVAEQNLAAGKLKLTDLLSQVAVEYVSEEELQARGLTRRIFTNVNTLQDLEHLER